MQAAPVDVAANDAGSRRAAVGIERWLVEPDERGRLALRSRDIPCPVGPLEVGSSLHPGHLFPASLTDVAEIDRSGRTVDRHAVGTARSDGPELLEIRSRGVHPRIVVRNVVALGVASGPTRWRVRGILRLPADRVAARGIAIDIDAKDSGKQAPVDLLARVVLVVRTSLVPDGEVEKSVVAEEEAPAVVPVVPVVLVDEDELARGGDRRTVGIPRKPGEPTVGLVAFVLVGCVAVVDVDELIVRRAGLGEVGVECHTHHATVVARLDLRTNVQQDGLRRGGCVVLEDGKASRLLQDEQPIRKGNRFHLDRIDEGEIGKRVDETIAARGGSRFLRGQSSVQILADALRLVETAAGLRASQARTEREDEAECGCELRHSAARIDRNHKRESHKLEYLQKSDRVTSFCTLKNSG